MMRALYAGISGLENHQTRMDVIGNNIANVNTTGFKSGSVNFQDVLSQTLQGASAASGGLGGTNPIQIGMGMGVASVSTNFSDGNLQSTGNETDLAISGQGFFVLGDGTNQVYSRAGGFGFDTAGNLLVPGTGYKVMGYTADSSGNINANQTVQNIQIPTGSSMAAKTSSKVTYANNLMSSATAISAANTAIVPAGTAVADTTATANAIAAVSAGVTADAAALTAAGVTLSGAFTQALTDATSAVKTAQNDATNYQNAVTALNATPSVGTVAAAEDLAKIAATSAQTAATAVSSLISASAASGMGANTTTAIGSLTAPTNLAAEAVTSTAAAQTAAAAANDTSSDAMASINVYDSQGIAYPLSGTFEKTGNNTWSFTPATTVKDTTGATIANVTAAPIALTFNADGSFNQSTAAATITITPTGTGSGASPFTITPDFSKMTQYGLASTAQATGQDGYTSGSLEKTSINSSGIIVGSFSNGQILNLAQIALANFNNPSGLGKTGDSLYVKTTNSGEPQVGAGGTGGRGTFNSGSLEMSNVDLAQQFSDMIVTQRGFQANSKIITTVDTMLDDLINLKR